jgi:hypothetical protein
VIHIKKDKNLLYISIFIVLCLAYVAGFARGISMHGGPWNSDFQLHYKIVSAWLDGENPLVNQRYFGNNFPYPPAFHLTIAILSKALFISHYDIFKVLQLFLFPLILASTLFLVKRIKNLYVGILAVCLLVSGIAFWDRSAQVIPNGFDALFFPLVVYAYMRGRRMVLIALGTFLVYNHLFYGVILLSALVAHSVKFNRERLRDFGIVGALCLPLFLFYAPYATNFGDFATGGETSLPEYQRAINHPLFNVAYLGYFFSAISFFSIIHFSTKKLSDFEKVLGLWVLALVPLYVLLPHRALPYLAHPFAIMGAITLDDYTKTEKQKNVVLLLLFVLSWVYVMTQYNIMGITASPIAREIAFLVGDFTSHESFISNLF